MSLPLVTPLDSHQARVVLLPEKSQIAMSFAGAAVLFVVAVCATLGWPEVLFQEGTSRSIIAFGGLLGALGALALTHSQEELLIDYAENQLLVATTLMGHAVGSPKLFEISGLEGLGAVKERGGWGIYLKRQGESAVKVTSRIDELPAHQACEALARLLKAPVLTS